jgi:hypothetical protein
VCEKRVYLPLDMTTTMAMMMPRMTSTMAAMIRRICYQYIMNRG